MIDQPDRSKLQLFLSEPLHLVPPPRRVLKFKVHCGFAHLFLEIGQDSFEIVAFAIGARLETDRLFGHGALIPLPLKSRLTANRSFAPAFSVSVQVDCSSRKAWVVRGRSSVRTIDKTKADVTRSSADREKLEDFSNRMFVKYGISKHGPMSDRLADLILRLRALKDK